MSKKAKRLVTDYVGQLSDGETVTVHQIAEHVNRQLRVASVSTRSVSLYCRELGLKRVSTGVWVKCR